MSPVSIKAGFEHWGLKHVVSLSQYLALEIREIGLCRIPAIPKVEILMSEFELDLDKFATNTCVRK